MIEDFAGFAITDLRGKLAQSQPYERRPPSIRPHGIVVHHTGGDMNDRPEAVARYHVEDRRWPGIAYHFWIRRNGETLYLNDVRSMVYAQAGVPPVPFTLPNTHFLSIVLPGDYTEVQPTQAQRGSLLWLITLLQARLPTLKPDTVFGHRDFKPTICPGDRLYAYVRATWPIACRNRMPHNVRQAQQVLDRLGFDLGPAGVDGIWGPDTRLALRKATGFGALHFESSYALARASLRADRYGISAVATKDPSSE